MASIDKNQYDYLKGLTTTGDGRAEWAKAQLAQSTYTPAPTTPTPAVKPLGTAPAGAANTAKPIGTATGTPNFDMYNDMVKNHKSNGTYTVGSNDEHIESISQNLDIFDKNKGYSVNYDDGGVTNPDGSFRGYIPGFLTRGDLVRAVSRSKYGESANSQQTNSGGVVAGGQMVAPDRMQTGTMQPTNTSGSTTATSGYTKNAEVDALPLDQQLAYYKAHPEEAKQEIMRAKSIWEQNPSNPQTQAGAKQWADMMRGAAGIDKYDSTYGSEDAPADGSGDGQGNGKSGTGDPILDKIWSTIEGTMNGGVGADAKAASDASVASAFNTKKSQYENLINSLKTGQSNDLQSIKDTIDGETNKIDDKSFQDWLAARQNIAGRGLAGSGLASDTNTRLLLAKQHNLADMFAGKNTAINDVNKRYSDKITTAQTEIANMNLPAEQAAALQKLITSGQGDMNKRLEIFTKLFSDLNKSNVTSEGNQLKAATAKYSTDVKYKYLYDKLDQDGKTKLAQLQLDWEKYNLDVTKVFGQDQNGNPTLDARKMVAEVSQRAQAMAITQAHNAVTENQGWARINQTDNDMALKIQAMTNQTEQFKTKMKSDSAKDQADSIKSIMTQEGSNLRSLRTQLSSPNLSAAQKKSLEAEYGLSLSKIEAAQSSMGEIYKYDTGKDPSTAVTRGKLTMDDAESNTTESNSFWDNFSKGLSGMSFNLNY